MRARYTLSVLIGISTLSPSVLAQQRPPTPHIASTLPATAAPAAARLRYDHTKYAYPTRPPLPFQRIPMVDRATGKPLAPTDTVPCSRCPGGRANAQQSFDKLNAFELFLNDHGISSRNAAPRSHVKLGALNRNTKLDAVRRTRLLQKRTTTSPGRATFRATRPRAPFAAHTPPNPRKVAGSILPKRVPFSWDKRLGDEHFGGALGASLKVDTTMDRRRIDAKGYAKGRVFGWDFDVIDAHVWSESDANDFDSKGSASASLSLTSWGGAELTKYATSNGDSPVVAMPAHNAWSTPLFHKETPEVQVWGGPPVEVAVHADIRMEIGLDYSFEVDFWKARADVIPYAGLFVGAGVGIGEAGFHFGITSDLELYKNSVDIGASAGVNVTDSDVTLAVKAFGTNEVGTAGGSFSLFIKYEPLDLDWDLELVSWEPIAKFEQEIFGIEHEYSLFRADDGVRIPLKRYKKAESARGDGTHYILARGDLQAPAGFTEDPANLGKVPIYPLNTEAPATIGLYSCAYTHVVTDTREVRANYGAVRSRVSQDRDRARHGGADDPAPEDQKIDQTNPKVRQVFMSTLATGHLFVSLDGTCPHGQVVDEDPIAYVWPERTPGKKTLYRCAVDSSHSFVSDREDCEGHGTKDLAFAVEP